MEPLNFNLYNLSSTYKFFLFYRVLTLHTQIYSRQINFIEIIIIFLFPTASSHKGSVHPILSIRDIANEGLS